jgi:hypothetical protein
MMLKRYLHRLYDTIVSRRYLEVEHLTIDMLSAEQGIIEGRLLFFDSSLLEFDETVLVRHEVIQKLRYAYHYQNGMGELIFRYDNAPHHPSISTYPHHKHVGDGVEPCQPPDLSEVMAEIEQLLFPP